MGIVRYRLRLLLLSLFLCSFMMVEQFDFLFFLFSLQMNLFDSGIQETSAGTATMNETRGEKGRRRGDERRRDGERHRDGGRESVGGGGRTRGGMERSWMKGSREG